MNGATCVDHVTSFTCNCPAGYTGDTCETGMFSGYEIPYAIIQLFLAHRGIWYTFTIAPDYFPTALLLFQKGNDFIFLVRFLH